MFMHERHYGSCLSPHPSNILILCYGVVLFCFALTKRKQQTSHHNTDTHWYPPLSSTQLSKIRHTHNLFHSPRNNTQS
ncbi:hypothetical protein I7I48_09320 [Histoplasma ohiense]|nr:hypothetical protein I7I48_09320 [Histoplasma ohiense (nom. inval.)]